MPTTIELLTFEARWPRHTSRKEVAILDDLGVKPARFYQLLLQAARSEAGMQHDPMTCRRVRARADSVVA